VITTSTTKVDAVPAKGSKPFRVEVTGAGIAAFRYTPIA
jgi:hypothetical protein